MALNATTFKTNADAVSDQLEAETDTSAHFDTAVAVIQADTNAMHELVRLYNNVGAFLRRSGRGPNVQSVIDTV